MDLFDQSDGKSCQIAALQTVLSYYNIPAEGSILTKSLQKHSFGNLITEQGTFLESSGINTRLISNNAKLRQSNILFADTLKEYKNLGLFFEREINLNDFDFGPVIANVDWYKVKNTKKGMGAHYVVFLKVNRCLWIYDSSNYLKPVKVSFNKIVRMSKNINKFGEDGMFIICNSFK